MGHESGLEHSGAVGKKTPRDTELVEGEDVGHLSDDQILETLERNQLSKVKRLAGDHTEDAIRALAQIMKNKKCAPAPRVTAARALLDYAHGRPGQQFTPRESASGDKLKIVILKLADGTTEELKEIDVTPGAPPAHEQGPKSVVAGVEILELRE